MSAASVTGVNLVLDEGGIATSDRVASSTKKGVTTTLSFLNRKLGRWAYLVVTPFMGSRQAEYTASIAVK